MLEARLLGKYEVCLNGRLIDVSSRPAQSLLAYLLLNPNQPIRREKLAGLIWPDSSESNARGNLRHALWRVRKSFASEGGAYLQADDLTISFQLQTDDWVDAKVLNTDIQDDVSFDVLIEILSVYAGELLPGFYEDWVAAERERLKVVFEHKMTLLLDHLLAESQWGEVINWGERWISLGFTPEHAFRSMMMAYAGLGDRGKVAAVYQRCVQALEEDLGVEPSRQTRDIYEKLKGGDRPGQVTQLDELLHIESRPRNNLPPSLTPLIGREADLEKVANLLQNPTCRLVNLVGPGGIGKTRLAIRVAEDLLPAFQHGAWFVPLDALESPDFIAEAIARALGLPLSGQVSPAEQVLESLRLKEILLVLDNFEHLLPNGTELLIEILHEAPGVQLLVTSREKLNLQAECLYEVRGLAYPQDGRHEAVEAYPAVALFLQLAQRAAGTALSDEDNRHVARIAQLVEGLPLALELAAVWTRAISCREIAEEIQGGLGFLQASPRDVPERHRSMLVVFEHSWRLLSVEERATFRRLSVFRGGFDRQAANQVAGGSLATLKDLVDKSLISHHPDGRYRIHTLLRQFAAAELERAGETEATRERHLAYFLQLAEQAEPQLWREQEKVWLDRLEAELDNLRKAVAWSLSPRSALGVQAGMKLVAAIAPFWWRRGHDGEAYGWLSDLLAHPQAAKFPDTFANCLRLDAFVKYWTMGMFAEVRGQFERRLAIAEQQGEPLTLAHVLSEFGGFCMDGERNLNDAEPYLERSLVLYRELGHEPGVATVLRRLGHVALYLRNDQTAARSYYRESLQLWKSLGPSTPIAHGLLYLARIRLWRGDFVNARGFLEESLALYRDMNEGFVMPEVLYDMGELEFVAGEITRATAYFEEALALARYSGTKTAIADALHHLGDVSYYQGEFAKALSQYDEALALSQDQGSKRFQIFVLLSKSFVFLRQGDRTRAVQLIEQCLSLSREAENPYPVAIALIGLAGHSASGGGPHRAARLWGAAEPLLAGHSASGAGPYGAVRLWEAAEPLPESANMTIVIEPAYYAEYKRIRAQIRAQLDKATFKQLVHEGRAMVAEGFDRLVEYALAESRS